MRFFSIGLSITAVASITSAYQCRSYSGGLKSTVTTTNGVSPSIIQTSTKTTTEVSKNTPGVSDKTHTTQATIETSTTNASIAESTMATSEVPSSTRLVDGNAASTTSSTGDSIETTTTDYMDEITTTSAPPSITSAETPEDTTESSTPTSAPAPLTTFSLVAGNTINTGVSGKHFFGAGDRQGLVLNPSTSDAQRWNNGKFNLEPGSNFLRVDDFYVVLWGEAIYLGSVGSVKAFPMNRIKCNGVREGEALSCAVDDSPWMTQFTVDPSENESVGIYITDPNNLLGYATIDLIVQPA